MRRLVFRQAIVPLLLSLPLVSAPSASYAQASLSTGTTAAPTALFINILEGEGELNDVRARTAREPIVEVQDQNHKPVAGALVLFSIRGSGTQAAANFSGLTQLSVRTGADGRAVGHGYQVTGHTGSVRIEVEASIAGLVVATVIHQTNYAHGNALSRSIAEHKAVSGFLGEVAGVLAVSAYAIVNAQSSATTITAGTGGVRQAQRRQ